MYVFLVCVRLAVLVRLVPGLGLFSFFCQSCCACRSSHPPYWTNSTQYVLTAFRSICLTAFRCTAVFSSGLTLHLTILSNAVCYSGLTIALNIWPVWIPLDLLPSTHLVLLLPSTSQLSLLDCCHVTSNLHNSSLLGTPSTLCNV